MVIISVTSRTVQASLGTEQMTTQGPFKYDYKMFLNMDMLYCIREGFKKNLVGIFQLGSRPTHPPPPVGGEKKT